MSFALELLGEVRWRQRPVVGDRPQALLAALAARRSRPVPAQELIELVWGEDPPVNGLKSLQVLVSRTRSACGADAITSEAAGYQLGAAPGEVDSVQLAELVKGAAAALDRDAAQAAELADQAQALGDGLPAAGGFWGSSPRVGPAGGNGDGPLAELRRAAAADLTSARVIRARAASKMGNHAAALPVLEAAWADRTDDESLLADLLRSEAAVRGPSAALDRYERYRRGLRDDFGTDPGEPLRRAHRELLALDRPVRRGLRYDATPLVGRDRDLDRLRALTASSRVVSIVGAGGLGKTRLAQAVARDGAAPITAVVELAGVSAADDVVGEVGSVLGVRDSIQGRRVLTPEQHADIRARIAQRLAQSSGLLVLDNCEHLVDAVADLVAFLVSAAPDLHVLTTSRAPLGIAAEHVYLLGELDADDGAELFRERAVAARPNVLLDEQHVRSIVGRLDGLPLAIELAAVQVRVMSVEEIDRRLEDRFALLRGGDRSAPDRHQTLLAVIDWSWNLLDSAERRALRWLALFNDGFTLAAAEEMLGGDAVAVVQGLVGQSLLGVREGQLGVRYRMLETVREFGHLQLGNAGEDQAAHAALRRWAIGYAQDHGTRLNGTGQFAAIDALGEEETNLADELRAAIGDGDHAALVQLLAPLGGFWMMRGEHARLMVLADAVTDAIRDWQPPPELAEVTTAAIALTLSNSLIAGGERVGQLQAFLRRVGAGAGSGEPMSGLGEVMLGFDPADPGAFLRRLEELADQGERGGDRAQAAIACFWLANVRENAGDLTGAVQAAQRALALVSDVDGSWSWAMPRALLAQFSMHMGDRAAAAQYARAALPVMRRLGAGDDEVQLRCLLVFVAIADGKLAEAEAELAGINASLDSQLVVGGMAFGEVCRAELALARGDYSEGLSLHRDGADRMRELEFPGVPKTGLEPWALFGLSMALAAHAQYATPDDQEYGQEFFRRCRSDSLKILGQADFNLDYPIAGMLLFALGSWALRRQAAPVDDAVRLLALARRFAYNQATPTLIWERITPSAEERAPGQFAKFQAEYADRRPADLLDEACRAVERLPE